MKSKRYITLATKVAEQSDYGKFRHGAVLVKGSSVRNVSCNKQRHCHFGKRFREHHTGDATLHAELGAILGMDRSKTQGATVYVASINSDGDRRMSKPCPMCENVLKFVGVKKVVYTTGEETMEEYKL